MLPSWMHNPNRSGEDARRLCESRIYINLHFVTNGLEATIVPATANLEEEEELLKDGDVDAVKGVQKSGYVNIFSSMHFSFVNPPPSFFSSYPETGDNIRPS
jgi:hypothetical protein